MKIVGCIFARGGSKGLPGKNIRMFCGKPLIAWSIEHTKAIERISRIIVSTDSEDIAQVALDYGAEVPFLRPTELAKDTTPEWMAWRHLLHYLREEEQYIPEIMVSTPATSPLRIPQDIDKCIDKYITCSADVVVTVTESYRNPWFNMVKKRSDGSVGIVNTPKDPIYRRQDAPRVFDMSTVAYVARPDYVMREMEIFRGKVHAVEVPVERAVDIDTLFDFQLAEFIMKQRALCAKTPTKREAITNA